MRIAVDDGMAEHGVAAQRTVIGFVVAHHEPSSADSISISGRAARSSLSHRMPACQGRAMPCIEGVKEWMETMKGGFPLAVATDFDQRRDRIVIGPMKLLQPLLALRSGIG
jgi:hypothetical protein